LTRFEDLGLVQVCDLNVCHGAPHFRLYLKTLPLTRSGKFDW
jgi:hypothetical protein